MSEEQLQEAPPEEPQAPPEEPQAPPEPAPEPQVDEATIAEATKYGWRPKEDYDHPNGPDGWVDADRYLELPSTQRKQLQAVNKNLQDQIGAHEEQMKRVADEAAKASRLAMQEAERRHREEVQRLLSAQREAVETADTELYDQLEQRKRELAQSRPQPEPEIPAPSAEFAELMKSDWIQDPMMRNFAAQAIELAGDEVKSRPDVEQFKYAEQKVREYFPQKFEKPKPTVQKVDGGGLGAAPKGKGKTASNLNSDERKIAQAFIEEGVFANMDEYLNAYNEQYPEG